MGFKRDPETGGLGWDKSTAGDRWGEKANRPDFVEMAELCIKEGMTGCVWDTLADPEHRPVDLGDDEERMIVRKALLRSVELGRLHENTAAVLVRLIGGSDRLKTENRVPHAEIRRAIRANRSLSVGQISRKFRVSKDTASRIKRDELSDD
jgi:hypothetical protein